MFDNKKRNAMIVLVMVMVLLCGCGKEPAETMATTEAVETTQAATEAAPLQELTVLSTEEQGDMMVVTTSFGQVKYPFAFGDLIQVKAVTDGGVAALEFSALISGEEYPAYAIRFGSGEGIVLGTLEVPGEAEVRMVSAEIYPADAALGDKANTFYAVQESFNDVVASLSENQGFVKAE